MPNTLATSVFLTGAKDKLATADVYTLATDNPINSIQAITAASNPSLAIGLTGSKGVSSLLSSLLSTAKSSVPGLNLTSAAARIGISLPSLSGVMSSLSSSAQSAILSNIGGGVGGAINAVSGAVGAVTSASSTVTAIVNNVSQVVTGAISDVAAIGSLISGNACNDTFALKDTSATVGALSGVIGVAMSAGIPNAFKALTCGVSDTGTMNGVIGNLLPSVVSSGDLGSLTAMATSASPGLMPSLYPGVLSDFSANYAIPSGNSASTIANGTTIASTFESISPGWDTTTRNSSDGTSFDLTSIQGASPDFMQAYCASTLATPPVISMDDPLAAVTTTTSQQAALLSSVYPSVDPMAALNAQYPATVADANQVITSAGSVTSNALAPTTTIIPSTTQVQTQTLQSGLSTNTVTTTVSGGGSTLTTYPPSSDGAVDSLPPSLQDPTPLEGANGASVCMTADLSSATATYGPEITNYANNTQFSAITYVFSDKSEVIVTTRSINSIPSVGATKQYIDSNQNTIRTSGGYGSSYGGATPTATNT